MKSKLIIFFQIALIGLFVFILNFYFFQICIVQGDSMYPTLKSGNILLVKKFNIDLKRNDIVVINKNNNIIIKRLVGLPNDKIKIDKYLYVNNEIFDDLYIENNGDINEEIMLKENEYFVLGDNRSNSIDSRFNEIGIIYENEIIGKIVLPKIKEIN